MSCPILVQNTLFGACCATIVQPERYNGLKYADVFAHYDVSNPHAERIRSLADRFRVIRASELKKYRIHHQILRRALDRGTVIKVHRGLYASKDFPATLDQRIVLACKRVPHGVVCLESALEFLALLPSASDAVWMAIDRKARKPALNGLEVRSFASRAEH